MRVDFESAFIKGRESYDTDMGDWWIAQAQNQAHRRAYRTISGYVAKFFPGDKTPSCIVDYATGPGLFLRTLAEKFPAAHFVGLDGSRKMLQQAEENLRHAGFHVGFVSQPDFFRSNGLPVRLVQSPLPNFDLPTRGADLVLFTFPNVNISHSDKGELETYYSNQPEVLRVAQMLVRLAKQDQNFTQSEEELLEDLLHERAIADNVHQLLKKNGFWIKVDYADTARKNLSEVAQWILLFSESALDWRIDQQPAKCKFRYLQNRFYRSSVVLDVYDQTQEPDDQTGGYFISVFQAL